MSIRGRLVVNHGQNLVNVRVSVQGVKSLGGHFAHLCQEFDFYKVKKKNNVLKKEKGHNFTLLNIFIVKSLQKEQNSTNLLLWPPIMKEWINVQSSQSQSTPKAKLLLQKLTHLFAREVLSIKKLEIEETKTTYHSTFKTDVGLVFSISNFSIAETFPWK